MFIGYVYDTEYSSLALDMRCTVSLDALPDFQVGGRIVSLTSVGSRKSFVLRKSSSRRLLNSTESMFS